MIPIPPGSGEERLRSYLLGKLPADEREPFEEQFFEDDDLYFHLQDAERDLLDDYARGLLPPEEARLVEHRLLGSEAQRRKLRLARGLAGRTKSVERREPRRRSWLPWVGAAAAIVVCAGLALHLYRQNGELRTELARLAAESERLRERMAAPRPGVVAMGLPALLTRSAAIAPSLSAPAAQSLVRLDLEVDDPYPAYRATVERAGSGTVWTADLAAGRGGVVALWMPGAVVRPGDYEIVLRGVRNGEQTLVGVYPLHVY